MCTVLICCIAPKLEFLCAGQAGRKAGNALGVLGLFFSAFESGINYFSEDYLPDGLATIGAGL